MAQVFVMFVFLLLVAVCSVQGSTQFLSAQSEKLFKRSRVTRTLPMRSSTFSLNGPGENQSYNRLALFTDTFGSRLSGSQNLENAIDYMLTELEKDGQENVHGEVVNVTHWVRNTEYAKLVEPREYDIAITGLGSSVGTPEEGILADAIVVSSFDDLTDKSQDVAGKNCDLQSAICGLW